MNYETKVVLKRSINEFLASSEDEQDEMIYSVQEKLKHHQNGLKSIGFGYAEEYIRAGEIFLRIFTLKQQIA